MKIFIRGVEEKKKKYLIRKVEAYIKLLVISGVDDHYLSISIKKKMKKDDLGAFLLQSVRRESDDIDTHHRIELNANILGNRYYLLKTLFHEMVHMRQYITRELIWVRWNSNSYIRAIWKKKNVGRIEDINYWEQPWEVEAHELDRKYWEERKL